MIEMIVLGLMLALALLSVTVGMILGAIDDCFFYYPLSSIDSKRHAKHEKLDKAKEARALQINE